MHYATTIKNFYQAKMNFREICLKYIHKTKSVLKSIEIYKNNDKLHHFHILTI